MEVITGKNVYIEFTQGSSFAKFGCAKSVTVEVQSEKKPVRGEGDGKHKRYRLQSLDLTISLEGLILFNDASMVTPFDLMGVQKSGIDIDYRIFFDDVSANHISAVYGHAMVDFSSIGGDTKFGYSSFKLQGQGEYNIGLPPVCIRTVIGMTITRQGSIGFRYKVVITALDGPTTPRFDYSIDEGTHLSAGSTGWTFDLAELLPVPGIHGTHTLDVWPVCENGIRGNRTRRTFTVPFGL